MPISLGLTIALLGVVYLAFGSAGGVYAQGTGTNDPTHTDIPMGQYSCTAYVDRIHRSKEVGVISVRSRTKCLDAVSSLQASNELYRSSWGGLFVTLIDTGNDTVPWINSNSQANANARGASNECLGTGTKKYRAWSEHVVIPTSGNPLMAAAYVGDDLTCPNSAAGWTSGVG